MKLFLAEIQTLDKKKLNRCNSNLQNSCFHFRK